MGMLKEEGKSKKEEGRNSYLGIRDFRLVLLARANW